MPGETAGGEADPLSEAAVPAAGGAEGAGKGEGGWAFADPTRYPLAPKKTYGDERAYQLRIAMERRAAEGIAEEATDEAVEAAVGDTI